MKIFQFQRSLYFSLCEKFCMYLRKLYERKFYSAINLRILIKIQEKTRNFVEVCKSCLNLTLIKSIKILYFTFTIIGKEGGLPVPSWSPLIPGVIKLLLYFTLYGSIYQELLYWLYHTNVNYKITLHLGSLWKSVFIILYENLIKDFPEHKFDTRFSRKV